MRLAAEAAEATEAADAQADDSRSDVLSSSTYSYNDPHGRGVQGRVARVVSARAAEPAQPLDDDFDVEVHASRLHVMHPSLLASQLD